MYSYRKKILTGNFLASFINEEKITISTFPPSILQTLSDFKLSTLRVVVTAGELCSQKLAIRWSEKSYFINAYGPTELTVCSSLGHVGQDFNHHPNIGKPIANTKAYVLDKHLHLLPMGVVGELYISGVGLSGGYLNQPALTKQKFISNSFDRNHKLYKTGDLARWLPNGNLDYIGRIDNQVKIRGFRIELEAVEEKILCYQGIKQCVVSVQKDKKNNNLLVAYIVSEKSNFVAESLVNFLKEQLPEYMVPSFFIKVLHFSLTQSGKIDRHSLPPVNLEQRFLETEYVPPKTLLEKKLLKIWSDLLDIKHIGIHDDFFHLGGHSLLITKLILSLTKQFNYNLSLRDFVLSPTIYAIARLLTRHRHDRDIYAQNFVKDSLLEPNIQFLPGDIKTKNVKAILLTGATGFLGVHLLYNLHYATDAKVYCLVRSQTEKSGLDRIQSALTKYKLENISLDRIVILKGDLSEPLLGLSPQQFDLLAEEIDSIYHNGAYVHHLYSYERLKAINVLSTIELLKLATHKKNKQFHYVSTLSAVSENKDHKSEVTEDFIFSPEPPKALLDGYNQTKWVSERLLTQASERGIAVKIYRPGSILGNFVTGVTLVKDNHLLLLLKGCIQMGYAPAWDGYLNILPVDFVSQIIVKISLDKNVKDRVFNIANNENITWINLINFLNTHIYSVKMVSPKVWQKKHLSNIDGSNALFGLLPFYMGIENYSYIEKLSQVKNIYIKNLEKIMRKNKIVFPKIVIFLERYFLSLKLKEFKNLKSALID